MLKVFDATLTQTNFNQVWWHTPTITALERLGQKESVLEASLDYRGRVCHDK